MMHRYRFMMAALALGLSAAACAGPQQPEVRLEGIRVGGLGLRGGTLIAQVLVRNPNGFDLETSALNYNLQVAHPTDPGQWVRFAEGSYDERLRVEARSSRILEVPIQFRYDDVGGAFRSILDTGSFNYRVTGDVRLSAPISRTFPFSRTGTVAMDGARE
jgi:LEA14-like dessication related protein